MSDMTKYTTGSNFYKAEHLDGKDLSLVVSHVDEEILSNFRGEEEEKAILSFRGDAMRLPLNVTNAKSMVKQYGRDNVNWTNKGVILYPTTCKGVNGDEVDCIRLKFPPAAPAAAVAPATEEQPGDVSSTHSQIPEEVSF